MIAKILEFDPLTDDLWTFMGQICNIESLINGLLVIAFIDLLLIFYLFTPTDQKSTKDGNEEKKANASAKGQPHKCNDPNC